MKFLFSGRDNNIVVKLLVILYIKCVDLLVKKLVKQKVNWMEKMFFQQLKFYVKVCGMWIIL